MARLKVFLDGQLESQHELSPHQDFVAGRGESCDCILRPERGISRQHFRAFQTELGWEVESLSRFGELYMNGEKIERSLLQPGQMFSVPPYEFLFEDGPAASSDLSFSAVAPPLMSGTSFPGGESHSEDQDERTQIGSMPSAAMLRLIDHRGQMLRSFSLQGSAWIGGRDISCPIFIDNNRISRRQFEIHKNEETYFIRDLASVNVTLVNGMPIPGDQWTQLQSSDVITVADWSLVFEIRDVGFEQRLSEIDPALRSPLSFSSGASSQGAYQGMSDDPGATPAMYLPPPASGGYAPSGAQAGMKLFGRQVTWLNPVRLTIIVVILLGGLYYLNEEMAVPEVAPVAQVQTPFEKLPLEKQQVVKQAYQLARDLYMTGRFELARQKIEEIHGIIPYYEDSQDLLKHVDIAISTQRDRDRLLAQQEDERRRQQKVREIVDQCRQMVQTQRDSISMEQLEICVQPALEFDPQNAEIDGLRKDVDLIHQEREIKAAQAADYQKKVAERQRLYQRAREIERGGRPFTAINAYMNVVKSGLPDPNNLKMRSQRRIASIEKGIRIRQNTYLQEAEAAYSRGDRRGAVKSLRQALKVNPGSSKIESRIAEIIAEIRKEMQPIYHEGILEESVGSVDTARQKFSKIMESSMPGEEYYEKAKIKMTKTYGQ